MRRVKLRGLPVLWKRRFRLMVRYRTYGIPASAAFEYLWVAPMTDTRQYSTCSECQKPLDIENARIDENGNPIHPECYLLRLRLSRDIPPSTET
jgi:hypothetical protein